MGAVGRMKVRDIGYVLIGGGEGGVGRGVLGAGVGLLGVQGVSGE